MMLSSILRGLVGLAVVLTLAGGLARPADAQSDARRKAEEALRNGIKAQSRRDHGTAVSLLSKAINSSALGRSELAIALYRRAISYRGQKQPARAISDINSALFFKNALPAKDRASAIELRLQAYRDAGLKAPALATSTPRVMSTAALQAPSGPMRSSPRVINTAPPRVSGPVRRVTPRQSLSNLPATAPILGGSSDGSPAPATVSAPEPVRPRISAFSTEIRRGPVDPPSVPAFTTRAAPAPSSVASVTTRAAVTPRGNWSTQTSSRPARIAATTPNSAVAQARSAGSYASTPRAYSPPTTAPRTAAPSAWRQPSVAAPQPSATWSRPSTTASSQREVAGAVERPASGRTQQGIGGFFSNLFGQSGSPVGVMPQTTSSLSREAPETTPQRKATPQVAAAPVPRAPEPEPAAGPRTPRSSGYEIELAALSDRFRAEAIAKQVMVQYSSDFFWSSRKTRLDERPGPEGSTIYGVRLGVYGDEASARDFCGKLEAGGFDCQIVARR